MFLYIFAVSFIPVEGENKDNIKTVLIFLLGYLSANGNYLTGGNPSPKKADVLPITGDNTELNINSDSK